MASRKKPGVAFWAAVPLVVLVLFPISKGPANRIVGMASSSA